MEPPGNADDPTTRASRNVSVRASLGPRRQRNQFAVTCRTTTVFWNNINSPLHDIGPPRKRKLRRASVNGNAKVGTLATGYVRLRDESGTRPWLSRIEVESGLIRWHEIILFLFSSPFFLVASSSILRYRVDRFMNYFIYIVWLPTLNGMFPTMLDELFQLRREIIRRWILKILNLGRGKKDEVATSIARVMEFSCCCGIALRYVGRASEF